MKSLVKLVLVLNLLVAFSCQDGGSSKDGDSHSRHGAQKKVETFYTCSMHPQIKEDKPGKCPICHMGLTKVEVEHDEEHSSNHEMEPREVEAEYYCEADPSVTSKAPGECPLDGTPMLKKTQKHKALGTVAKIKLRKSQLDHFRADVFPVTTMKMEKKIRMLGSLRKSEEKESNIPARVPGRVEDVLIQSTGSLIKKGDAVIKLYSPRLLTGGEEYLIARRNYFTNNKNREFRELYQQSRERLKLWGVQDFQLEEWANKRKIPREITIYSPVTGIVERKNAVVGKYFKEGQSFFDLVDLSSLWVELDVYEHDSALVRLGQNIDIEFTAYPGEVWQGKIDFVSPVLDQKTRTLKIRTTLKNTEGKLRPGMVGSASLKVELEGEPLVIPKTAVIDTGKRKVVWLKNSKDRYQANEIRTGFESSGYVEVKDGLSENDQVVIEGNFLLDAQAKLFGGYSESNSKAGGGHAH